MSLANAHPATLQARLRRLLVGAAFIALAAWLFEFSTHIHLAADDVGSPGAAHLCGYCAAMQAGAGPVSTGVRVEPASRGYFAIPRRDLPGTSAAPASYRSRAPPVA